MNDNNTWTSIVILGDYSTIAMNAYNYCKPGKSTQYKTAANDKAVLGESCDVISSMYVIVRIFHISTIRAVL